MKLPNTNSDYSSLAKFLNWLMAFIWIGSWIIGYLAVTWRTELNPGYILTDNHKAIASSLLFLIVLRTLWRLKSPPPALPDTMTPAVKALAHVGHLLLYAIALIAMPVSGWLWSSVADKPIFVLWLYKLPPLTSPHLEYYGLMKDIHVSLAYITGALVAGHIIVSLKHAIVEKDGIMTRMLPRFVSRRFRK
jgi:cytochrome b561